MGIVGEVVALGTTLPTGSTFDFRLGEDGVLRIDYLGVPKASRGVGKAFLARVLATADRHGMAVALDVDSTDRHGDPPMRALVNMYRRLGFSLVGMTDQDWVAMRREPRPVRDGAASFLVDYESARVHDMSGGGVQGLARARARRALVLRCRRSHAVTVR